MSIFDAIDVASNSMRVHRYRSEIAAQNLSNVYSNPNYRRKVVDLQSGTFDAAMSSASAGSEGGRPGAGTMDPVSGAVRVTGVHEEGGPGDERQQAFLGVVDMMRSKSAFELNMRAATMLKSMALSALEIGRGG